MYRFNTFALLIFQTLSFGMFFYLWSSIYRSGGQIGEYSLEQLISYYLIVTFLGLIMRENDVAWNVGDEIRLGTITNILLKPISYFSYKMSQNLGRILYKMVIYSAVLAVLFLILRGYFSFSMDALRLFYFAISVVLGLAINIIFFYIIGLSAFWFGFIGGFNFATHMIVNFLSGFIIPLDLLPGVILKINNFLPFKYMTFVPVSIFNGRAELGLSLLLIPLVWIIGLYIFSAFLFKKGIRKYEGYGA